MTGETGPEAPRTGVVIRRALAEAPALARGLRLTLVLAMVGQAISVITPIVLQIIIDTEILDPNGIGVGNVLRLGGVALSALVMGVIVGRVSLLRLVRSAATGLSDLRAKTFSHIMHQSVLHVQAERRGNLLSG